MPKVSKRVNAKAVSVKSKEKIPVKDHRQTAG